MATKQFLFDTTFKQPTNQSPQLQFEFTRPFSTVTPGGAPIAGGVGASLARYWHHNRLLCACPTVTQYGLPFSGYGGFQIVHSAGVDLDSQTPLLSYYSPDQGKLQIYRGTISNNPTPLFESVIGHGDRQTGTDPKRGWEDLFSDQPMGTGSNDTDQLADNIFRPVSLHVCHGLVAAVCEVRSKQPDVTFNASAITFVETDPNGNKVYDVTISASSVTTPEVDSCLNLYFDNSPAVPRTINSITIGSPFVIRVTTAFGDATSLPSTFPASGVIPRWRPESTALCSWQNSGTSPMWHRHWVAPNAQEGHPRGSAFQCQGFRLLSDQDPVNELWIPFADYVINFGQGQIPRSSNGGRFFLVRATRNGVNTAWQVGAVANPVTLPALSFTQEFGYHAHSAHVERYVNSTTPALNGLRLVCAVGDVWANNRVTTAYINDQNNYATASQWTVSNYSHGSAGSRHDASSSTTYRAVGEGNQYVGSAPYGWPGGQAGQIIGCDEMPVPLARAYAPTGATPSQQPLLEFTRLYGAGCAAPNRNSQNRNFIFNCFFVGCQSHTRGGPFAAHFAPGSQDLAWSAKDEASRLLFSPDGEHWGQCFAINHRGTLPAVFFGNEIVFGSLPDPGRGLRSVTVPLITVARPLALGCGGTNLQREGDNVVAGIGAGNTVERILANGDLPTGVPPPPCAPYSPATALPTTYRCTVPSNGTDQNVGIFKLTNDATIPANSKVKVRFWVYPLTPTGTGAIASCWVANVALGMYANQLGDIPKDAIAKSREEFALGPLECVGDPVRGWYPVTLDTDTQAEDAAGAKRWRTDGNGPGNPQNVTSFPLGLRLLSRVPIRALASGGNADGEPPNPTDFLIAFDYVVAGTTAQEHPGVPLPLVASPPASSGGEEASVTGFTCSEAAWTIQLVGEVPDDAWDHTDTDRPTDKVLCTLWQSSTAWVSVIADPANNAVVFKSSDGHTFSVTAASPEKFYFLRGSPVFIAVRRTTDKLKAFVSVGGTSVVGPVGLTGVTPNAPTQVRFGDQNKANVQPMLWYGGRIDEAADLADSAVLASLRSLGMMYTKTIPLPPGPIPE